MNNFISKNLEKSQTQIMPKRKSVKHQKLEYDDIDEDGNRLYNLPMQVTVRKKQSPKKMIPLEPEVIQELPESPQVWNTGKAEEFSSTAENVNIRPRSQNSFGEAKEAWGEDKGELFDEYVEAL